jgi:hypothetical protein
MSCPLIQGTRRIAEPHRRLTIANQRISANDHMQLLQGHVSKFGPLLDSQHTWKG